MKETEQNRTKQRKTEEDKAEFFERNQNTLFL